MASPSPTISPITSSIPWCFFKLGGVASPGTIPKNGIKGFKRETGWDKKKGKGTQGATLTLTSAPPCEGEITLQLFTTQDFTDWDVFVSSVLSTDTKSQQAAGLSIYHPAFSSIGLTQVVIESYTPPEHQGKGMYHVVIKLCEWQQPPATSVVSTVSTTVPDASNTTAPVDVEAALLQTTAAALLAKATQAGAP